MTTNENFQQSLKKILGNSAFDNDMTVPTDMAKCIKALNYLKTQLLYVSKDDKEMSEYAVDVIERTIEILT